MTLFSAACLGLGFVPIALGRHSLFALIIGIIVAEFFTAISGLGGMIVEYANVFATAKLFVPIIVIALIGVILTELVMWLERRMSRWRTLERERF